MWSFAVQTQLVQICKHLFIYLLCLHRLTSRRWGFVLVWVFPFSQWKAGRVSKLWLMQEQCGWLAAGFLLAFWGGAAAGFACPTGACWLAGGRWQLVGKGPDGPSWHRRLAKPWQCGTSCWAGLAQGQPLWRVPSRKRASPTSVGVLGAQCAGQDALARCPLCRWCPHRPRWGAVSAGSCYLGSRSTCINIECIENVRLEHWWEIPEVSPVLWR